MALKIEDHKILPLRDCVPYQCFFSFFNDGLKLFSDSKIYLDKFKYIYKHFIEDDISYPGITCYILSRSELCDMPCVIVNGILYRISDDVDVAASAEMIIFKKIFERLDRCFLLHAGVVSKNEKGYVICAPSGFGKTTLVMELVSKGYKFLSDEYCPVNIEDYHVTPFPRRVGLTRNSIFLKRDDVNRFSFLQHETKQFVDCNDMFPGAIGTECLVDFMIMLTAEPTTPVLADKNIIILAMFNENQSLMAELINSGVAVLDKLVRGFYIAYRLNIPRQGAVTEKFQKLWKKYQMDIFYVQAVECAQHSFNRAPTIEHLGESAAAFEILTRLINRSPAGKLHERYEGKSSKVFLKIGEFANNLKCYKMTTGRLSEMADIIDSLQ